MSTTNEIMTTVSADATATLEPVADQPVANQDLLDFLASESPGVQLDPEPEAEPVAVQEPVAASTPDVPLDFTVQDIGADPMGLEAGALPAGVVKVGVNTYIGNRQARQVSVLPLQIVKLTAGDAANSWAPSTGTAIAAPAGDLTIGTAVGNQRRLGTQLNTALNDDDRNLAVLGQEWREFQLLNDTILPTGVLNLCQLATPTGSSSSRTTIPSSQPLT